MGILKKLLLLISSTLVVAFIVIGLIAVFGIQSSTTRLVGALEASLSSENEHMMTQLDENFGQIRTDLNNADQTARDIVTALYDESFTAAITSLGNQMLPSIEAFDYDTPIQNIKLLMASNPAIKWIRFSVSENPAAEDMFVFGELGEGPDRKIYETSLSSSFAYLKLEMQTSMAGLEALSTIGGIFSEINAANDQLVKDIKSRAQQATQNATTVAIEAGDAGQKRMLWMMCATMLGVLLLVCVVLGISINKSVNLPLTRTVAMIQDMEKGRLDNRLSMERSDEIGQMAVAMDSFADNLQHEVVAGLQHLVQGDRLLELSDQTGRQINIAHCGAGMNIDEDKIDCLGTKKFCYIKY